MKDKKTGGRDFIKGQITNPGGRPKLSPEDKVLKKLTKDQFREISNLIVQGNWQALTELEKDPETSVLKKLICKALQKAHEQGDWGTVDRFLDRLIGKTREELEVHATSITFEKLDGSAERYTMGPAKEDD